MIKRLIIPLLIIALPVLAYLYLPSSNSIEMVSSTSKVIDPTPVSPISIDYLKSIDITTTGITIENELTDASNYHQYIASYISEGNKIYGLLTVPLEDPPEGGYPAIIFNHGYIAPSEYQTTTRYVEYVDNLAKNGFIVFKIDYRGNGESEGDASGTYFSSAYTIDVLSALKSLQTYSPVNPNRIGLWGHSMAGNLVLRSMLVSSDFKAGVIWAGAVYSYADFAKYGISDSSYVHRPYETKTGTNQNNRDVSPQIQQIRNDKSSIDFNDPYWTSVSLTANINYLLSPIQIHHAVDDPVVNVNYSRDLENTLKQNNKAYEYYEYTGGGHNLSSPHFEQAMQRTVSFFEKNL